MTNQVIKLKQGHSGESSKNQNDPKKQNSGLLKLTSQICRVGQLKLRLDWAGGSTVLGWTHSFNEKEKWIYYAKVEAPPVPRPHSEGLLTLF